jgi:hypothetical protein
VRVLKVDGNKKAVNEAWQHRKGHAFSKRPVGQRKYLWFVCYSHRMVFIGEEKCSAHQIEEHGGVNTV